MTTDNKPAKQAKTAAERREETDAWLRQPIGNTDTLVHAIKFVAEGLAQVSESRVDGPRIARMVHLCKLAAQKNPVILECTRGSLVWALLDAARAGLEPDGEQGALVPYKTELRFQPMYKGLIHLIAESGACHDLDVVAVFRGDVYKVVRGTSPMIIHEPMTESERDWKDLIACYVVFRLRDGSVKFDEMNKAEIEKRRNMSRAKDGPWSAWPVEMAKKTVIKRGVKTLPRINVKVRDAVEIDNRAEANEPYLASDDERLQLGGIVSERTARANRGNAALAAHLGEGAAGGDRVPAASDDGEELGQPAPVDKKAKGRAPPPDKKADETLPKGGEPTNAQSDEKAKAKEPDAVEPPVHKPASALDGPAIMDSQRNKILDLCDRLGSSKAEDRLRVVSSILGVQVGAIGALSVEEADKVIAALEAERAKRAEAAK